MNYIYSNYPTYSGYQWYFTGHSLGGYLAAKTYLDIRSANWLTSTPWKYGGAVNKKTISGVYTFNPLPIPKNQISSTQWNANINKVYDSEIKNLYIENEWLNGVYDMHSDKMAYFGFKGAVPSSIPTYKTINYTPKGSISGDLAGYYAYSLTHKKAVTDNHGISALAPYVSN
ncbi:hypothetical protein ACFVT8_03465 [Lysinibacillus sp. NPDC058147]|uniref:hypothetical protein n=1 Tax=unclassified Lysinibacillus TaxID=2636778 RepID=UPI0036DA9D1E